MTRPTITLLMLAACGWAQDQPALSGPVLGYALHAGSLRPLFGIPGAVTWGPAVLEVVDPAAASPALDAAIACAGGEVFAATLERPDERVRLFEGACTRIAFSEGGRSAVVYDEPAKRIVVITGLPASARVARELEWSEGLAAVAISDDAARLVAASGDSTFLISADGSRLALPGAGAAGAIAISGQTSWVSARDEAVLLEIDLAGEAAVVRSSATVPSAAALAVSRDRSVLVVVNQATGEPVLWHTARREPIAVQGACQAHSVQVLDGNAVFRLAARDGGSCILDADRDPPKFFLLPGAPQ